MLYLRPVPAGILPPHAPVATVSDATLVKA